MSKKVVTLTRWEDIENDFYTEEEIRASDLRVALMSELIKARQDKGITQKELEKLSGVSQPVIARMETGKTNPQIDTILRVLAPLGKTLKVAEIE
ncbi:MAG: helix-turn-helix domain-containing protein [Saccharofermentanales bacterium]|jgi:predicted transcriptional regulator